MSRTKIKKIKWSRFEGIQVAKAALSILQNRSHKIDVIDLINAAQKPVLDVSRRRHFDGGWRVKHCTQFSRAFENITGVAITGKTQVFCPIDFKIVTRDEDTSEQLELKEDPKIEATEKIAVFKRPADPIEEALLKFARGAAAQADAFKMLAKEVARLSETASEGDVIDQLREIVDRKSL